MTTKYLSTATRNFTKRTYATTAVERAARAIRLKGRAAAGDFVRPAEWRTDCEWCGVVLTGFRSKYCSQHCGKKAWHVQHQDRYDAWQLKRQREDPQKWSARVHVNDAVRDGKIAKPSTCSDCGKAAPYIEGHHHKGYDKAVELDVVWLCKKCHAKRHPRGKVAA